MEPSTFIETLSFVKIEWIKPLAKMLRDIRGQRAEEVKTLDNDFGDTRLLLDYYVIPNCQHHNPADHNEEERSRSLVKAPVYDTLDNFLGSETVLRDGRNQLFVLADAGMGKTSLLLMLKLWHLFAFWPKGYDCLLLKLGEKTLDTLNAHADKAHTVLLLDALDEDPQARGRISERLKELLDASKNFRHVIITCRTQFFPPTSLDPFGEAGRVRFEAYRCPMLFLSLFDDKQVAGYLLKRFPDTLRDRLRFRDNPLRQKAQTLLQPMKSLRFRPLLLAYIDVLLKVKARLTDPYQVFQALVEVWLMREIGKMEKQKLQPVPAMEQLWAACRLMAVYLQTMGKRAMSPTELDELKTRLPSIAHLDRLDIGGRSLLNRNSEWDYRFAHYSIQEFLVANALIEGVLIQDLVHCPPACKDKKPKVTGQLLDFIKAGLGQDRILPEWVEHLDGQDVNVYELPGWVFRDALQDGGAGPEMVVVPAGEFFMGARENEAGVGKFETPRHRVRIAQPFAMGRHPVTFQDYDHYCEATGRDKPDDQRWGRKNRPVINVSWQDAVDYAAWLSEQTGKPYRLPSEAEWEYAARAGTETAYWWGDEIGVKRANCRESGSQWSGRQTSPVGSFPANPFGLFDTAGNVWEWTQDRWHQDYRGAPENGSAWESGGSSSRVLRGGSWFNYPDIARSSYRRSLEPDLRHYYLGFRLVCSPPITDL